jgi:hypothetical protein
MSPTAKAILAATGLLTTCVIFGLAHFARKTEQQNLLNRGVRVNGRVLSVGREEDRAGMPLVLQYEFVPVGASLPVRGKCVASAFTPYSPGDSVVVCYNKALPASSIILSPRGEAM